MSAPPQFRVPENLGAKIAQNGQFPAVWIRPATEWATADCAAVARMGGWCKSAVVRELSFDGFGRNFNQNGVRPVLGPAREEPLIRLASGAVVLPDRQVQLNPAPKSLACLAETPPNPSQVAAD